MKTSTRALAVLIVSFIGVNALPDESKAYCTAELGQVLTNSTEVFDEPS